MQRQRRTTYAAAFTMLIVGTSLVGCPSGPGGDFDLNGLAVGKEAPPIEAQGWINGKPPSEEKLAGKVVVVNAWAHW